MHQSISKWISFQMNRPTQSIPGSTLQKIYSLFCLIEDLVAICSLSFLDFYWLKYVNNAEFLIIWLIVQLCFMFHENVHNTSISSILI